MNTQSFKEINEVFEKAKAKVKEYSTSDLLQIYNTLDVLYYKVDDIILKESIMDVMSIILEEYHERRDN